jgi:methanogenic corrinoid protein MtbC1
MVEDLRTEGDSLKIVKTVERENADFIRLPALMTTTMPSQKETIYSFTRAIGVLTKSTIKNKVRSF